MPIPPAMIGALELPAVRIEGLSGSGRILGRQHISTVKSSMYWLEHRESSILCPKAP